MKYGKDKALGRIMFWQYTGNPDNVPLDAVNQGFGVRTGR